MPIARDFCPLAAHAHRGSCRRRTSSAPNRYRRASGGDIGRMRQHSPARATHEQQGSDAAYIDALGCPVRFRQAWCGFELAPRLADRRIDRADPETRRIAAKYLDSQCLPRTASLSDRVAELIRRLLPTGQCSAESITNHLGMHPRTLYRRLATEGWRCHDLIERERRAQAANTSPNRGCI